MTATGHGSVAGPGHGSAAAPLGGAPDGTTAETRRSARSGAAGLVGAAASGLFGFLLAVVITRGYGPDGAGAFFAAIGVVTVATAVCALGAETGLMWALPRAAGPLRAASDAATGRTGGARVGRILPVALAPPLAVSLILAVGGGLAAGWLAPELLTNSGSRGRALLALSFGAVPVVVAMTLLLAVLRCVRPIRWYVAVQFFLLPISRPLLVGGVALLGGGLVIGMTGWLLPAAVAVLVCLILVAGPLGHGATSLRATRSDWRAFWGFALPRAVSSAIDAGSMWIGVLLTAALAGQADAGVFGAVGRYVLAGQLAMQGLRVAVSPQLSRLFGGGQHAAAARVHRQMTTWGIVLSWPVYLLLAVFGLGFLELFGPGFVTGAPAMTVLAVAMLVNTAVGNVQSLLLMGGRSGRHLLATVAGLTANVTLGLALIPPYGVRGAAVAWGVGIVVENVSAAVAARRMVGHPLVDGAMTRAALLVAGRGATGLGVAVALLGLACVGLLTVGPTRQALWAIVGQIRGRQ